MPLAFWNSTNSCIKPLMITEDEFKLLEKTKPEGCGKEKDCNYYVNHVRSKYLIVDDYFINNYNGLEKINRLNLSMKFDNYDQFKKMMVRLIINPSESLQHLIYQQIKQFPKEYTSIQIRSGGKLANSHESTYWITEKELPSLKTFIQNQIIKHKLSTHVYLSTDSDIIENYLKENLVNIHFLSRIPLKRRHSTNGVIDNYDGALFDLFIASRSNALLYTKHSSFGTLMKKSVNATRSIALPIRRREY